MVSWTDELIKQEVVARRRSLSQSWLLGQADVSSPRASIDSSDS